MTPRWVLHVDLDQFQAAVELLRHPELVGQPIVVGGDGDPTIARQVVTCASYEARAFGVHAGMPLRLAARRCPQAAFLPLDAPAYQAASDVVMTTLQDTALPVEVWGWDEAFVGASTDEPETLADGLQRLVFEAAALRCSIGIGDTKLRAKTATGFAKPAGIRRLTAETWMPVMGHRKVGELWGVGKRGAAKFAARGITTVGELAAADTDELAAWLGPTIGPRYQILARGEGGRHIRTEPWIARSRSRQTTYPRDLTDRADIEERVSDLASEIAGEVVAEGRRIHKVAVIVRSSSFFTESHVRSLPEPTIDVPVVRRAALEVLRLFPLTRPVRLLGVRVDLDPVDHA
jgi:DNA polymerase IV